ncbi:claudin-18-like [Littorina saxatilis]|uniref:claudin-18-like n=1 Tax=Littorina saxatilis TaxID=31220 RepID=UPI0038B61F98
MMTTCCAIVGLVFLVLTNLAAIIAFATPYWISTMKINRGLWAYCDERTCTWVFQEAPFYLDEQSSTWWLATQGLMCVGLGLTLFALLVATIALCCECKGCNSSHAVSGLLLLAFLVLGVAVVVFGISANQSVMQVGLEGIISFAWAFWLACAASGLALFSSIVYCLEGRTRYSYRSNC